MSRPFVMVATVLDEREDDVAMLQALGRHRARVASTTSWPKEHVVGGAPIPSASVATCSGTRTAGSSSRAMSSPTTSCSKPVGHAASCAVRRARTLYRGDARHLVRAGLEGGKDIDESIAGHPAAFVTLTAPGFGMVHRVTFARYVSFGERSTLWPRPPGYL